MAVDNIQSTSFQTVATNSETVSIGLVTRAELLGIDVEEYYEYDDEGNVTGVDIQKLSAAINEAMSAQTNTTAVSQDDEFVRTTAVEDEENQEADELQTTIDKDYNKAVMNYLPGINMDADSLSDEGKIVDEWENIREQADKLTSVDASNATVLQGVNSFLEELETLVKTTKYFVAEKNSEEEANSFLSLKTIEDIQDEQNAIQTYEAEQHDNPFASNPFYNSALTTFTLEDEEEPAADLE